MGGGSTVSGSRIQNAGVDGIEITGSRASVIGNVVLQSGGVGVYMKDGVVAQNVISGSNASPAIYLFGGRGGGVIEGNQLSENSSGADVASTSGTVIRGNAIRSNTSLAINGSGDDGYEGNVLSENAGSPQVSGAGDRPQRLRRQHHLSLTGPGAEGADGARARMWRRGWDSNPRMACAIT